MFLKIDEELIEILRQIVNHNKSDEEWSKVESSDMFQSKHYCGGYDSIEEAFCFSYYPDNGNEKWFQISLEEVNKILKNPNVKIETRVAKDEISSNQYR